jgi:hypothetical protein
VNFIDGTDGSRAVSPSPSSGRLGSKLRRGDSQCVEGLSGGRDSPAAEGLSLPLEFLLEWWSRGSYSLEAMWTMRSTTLLL